MVKPRAKYMRNYRQRKREEKLKNGKVEPKKIANNSTQRTKDFRARAANSILSQTSAADPTIALPNLVVSHATLRLPSLPFRPTLSTSTATACNTSPTEIHPHPADVEQERVDGEDVDQMEHHVNNSKSRAEYMRNYRRKKREEHLKTGKVEQKKTGKVGPKIIAINSIQRTRDYRARAANSILSQSSTADSTIALSNLVVSHAALRLPSLSFCPSLSISKATACNTSPTEIQPHPAKIEQERVVGEDVEQMELNVNNSKSRAEYMRKYRQKKREQKLKTGKTKSKKTGKVGPKKIAKSSTQRSRDYRARVANARAANSILSQSSTADPTIALPNLVVSHATLRLPSLPFCPTPYTSTVTACNTSPTEIHLQPADIEQKRVIGEDFEHMELNVNNSTVRQYNSYQKLSTTHDEFKTKFLDNNFGAVCNVCDRLWYESDMKSLPPHAKDLISAEFPHLNFETACICSTCHLALSNNKIPSLSKSNGFKYPSRPPPPPEVQTVKKEVTEVLAPILEHFNDLLPDVEKASTSTSPVHTEVIIKDELEIEENDPLQQLEMRQAGVGVADVGCAGDARWDGCDAPVAGASQPEAWPIETKFTETFIKKEIDPDEEENRPSLTLHTVNVKSEPVEYEVNIKVEAIVPRKRKRKAKGQDPDDLDDSSYFE